MTVIVAGSRTLETINIAGEFVTIFLIISLIAALLLSNSKYWNRLTSESFDICRYSLFLTFMTIVIFKIIMVIR